MAINDQTALHVTTRVGPGHRIEIEAPGLPEGEAVEVFVVAARPKETRERTLLEFLESIPTAPRSAAGWAEFEAEFQEERSAWDR